MDPRQVLAMLLPQNAQLKQELSELKGQVAAQATAVTERVLDKVEGRKKDGPMEPPLQLLGHKPPALEDMKSKENLKSFIGPGNDWRTPPESVSAKKSLGISANTANSSGTPGDGQPVSGAAGTRIRTCPVRFWDRWRRLSAVSSRSHLEGPKVKEKTFVEDQGMVYNLRKLHVIHLVANLAKRHWSRELYVHLNLEGKPLHS